MLLYNDIVIGKYIYMIVGSQLAAFCFLKYQGQVLAIHSFNVIKYRKSGESYIGEMQTVVRERRTTCF